MKKFEYKIVALKYAVLFGETKELTEAGLEGWEAVGMAETKGRVVVIMKRELK